MLPRSRWICPAKCYLHINRLLPTLSPMTLHSSHKLCQTTSVLGVNVHWSHDSPLSNSTMDIRGVCASGQR
jgi:hypothetical protein